MKMEAAGSLDTLVITYETAPYLNLEDRTPLRTMFVHLLNSVSIFIAMKQE
jgi:hypothetical protein